MDRISVKREPNAAFGRGFCSKELGMSEPLACLNGRFLPQSDLHVAYFDAGFILGATGADLLRTFRQRLFRLDDHLARFRRSCNAARIPQSATDAELAEIAERLVTHNAGLLAPDQELALVVYATPGPISYYAGLPGGPGDGPPTLALHTFPLPLSRYARFFRDGAHIVVPTTRHVPLECVDPRIKQRSRLTWWIAECEAHDVEPGSSALLLDANDYVTETAGANFLIVKNDAVLTPPRSSVLGGISLLVVEELCRELGIAFEERPLTVADCLAADEAMLASTPYCLAGVRRINGQRIPWPGPVLRTLLTAWSAKVAVDIPGQVLSAR
jgi:branched-chain amino acid aminotransferase